MINYQINQIGPLMSDCLYGKGRFLATFDASKAVKKGSEDVFVKLLK